MTKVPIRRLHPVAGGVALVLVASFFTATAGVEAFGDAGDILAVKTAILWGLGLLVPAMALVGATGFRLGARSPHPLVAAKRRRMPVIALNGILVLVPAAIVLHQMAAAGDFGAAFVAVQALEFAAGGVNLALLGLSMRDGLRLKGRIGRARAA